MSDSIQQAIAALEAERGVLVERLRRLDQARATLLTLADGSPDKAVTTAPPRASGFQVFDRRRALKPRGDTGDLQGQLLQALQDMGPSSTGTLAAKVKSDRVTVRELMKTLASKGLVRSEGATVSQRWHLGAKGAGRTPAKEAPSRR